MVPEHHFLPFVIALLCVPAFALTDWQEGAARAFGWVNLAYIPPYIVRPLAIVAIAGGIIVGLAQGFMLVFRPAYFLTITFAILILAANTAYQDFPRLSSILARAWVLRTRCS